jgi:hypothetical protein
MTKMLPIEDNKLICGNHINIIHDSQEAQRLIESGQYELALEYLDRIQTYTVRAFQQGRRMEDRLKEYKESICKLGFERTKND